MVLGSDITIPRAEGFYLGQPHREEGHSRNVRNPTIMI